MSGGAASCTLHETSLDIGFILCAVRHFLSALVAVWDWTAHDLAGPTYTLHLQNLQGPLSHVCCHPDNPQVILATGPREVALLQWTFGGKLTADLQPAEVEATFAQSTFLPVSLVPCQTTTLRFRSD